MAFVRTSTGGVTENSITVLVDGLQYAAGTYDMITIHGAGEIASVNYGGGRNSNGTYRSATTTFRGLQAGTEYSFYAKARKNAGGRIVLIPTIYVTTKRSRPSNFDWDVAKVQGGNFNITASEWNRLQNKVNEFRLYKGLDKLTNLTNVSRNETFTAEHFNKIVRALHTLYPSMTPPYQVSVGDDITANKINLLKNSLNSVS